MGDSAAKKPKLNYNKKPNYHMFKNKKNNLESGQKGFLATCNFQEKNCVRECYNLLNDFADKLYEKPPSSENTEKNTQDDIADALQKEIIATKVESNKDKFRFQNVDTGANNCIFIKTTLENPVELGAYIANSIAENKSRKTRYLLRLIPIDIVCRANIKDMVKVAEPLFEKHFSEVPKTFSIVFNKRFNNDIKRDDVIKDLAEIVASKNDKNKVDLKNAETTVVVEIIKGLCCLSVVPNYLKLKKYNLSELANSDEKTNEEQKTDDVQATTEANAEDPVKE